MFQKGVSGNPHGRPRKTPKFAEVEILAKQHAPEAITRLAYWIGSDDPRASISAAVAILNRAYGLPKQAVNISGDLTVTTAQTIEEMHRRVRELRLATDNGRVVDAA
jgi:hypothetical protein